MAGNIAVKFFTSYAHHDRALADKLLSLLDIHFKISAKFAITRWADQQIFLGQGWHGAIQQALQEADFGLLLLSPAFLASDYIVNDELAQFLQPDGALKQGKRIIPVGLAKLDMDTMDMRGLQHRQIYSYQGKTFRECDGKAAQREAFVLDLLRHIDLACTRNLTPTK